MLIPKFLSNLCRCVCVCVCVQTTGGCRDPALLFSHLGLLTSSESAVIRLAGTAGQLHNYHLPETTFVFDVVPQTTMLSFSSSPTGAHSVLITKAITICIQTAVSQTAGQDPDVGRTHTSEEDF